MKRRQITEADVQNPTRLRQLLDDAHGYSYKLLEDLEELKTKVGAPVAGRGSPGQTQTIINQISAGSTDSGTPPQNSLLRMVTSLPAIATSTDGELVLYNSAIWRYSGPALAWQQLTSLAAMVLMFVRADRLALYPAASYPVGTLGYETDTDLLYIVKSVVGVNTWRYLAGTWRDTLANIPAGGSAPTVDDVGLLFYATDYHHTWRWSGSAWSFAPGDDGSGYIAMFTQAPNCPGSAAWQLCDGSTVARTNATASTSNVTVPDLRVAGGTPSFPKLQDSAYTGTPAAAAQTGTESVDVAAAVTAQNVAGCSSANPTVITLVGTHTVVAGDVILVKDITKGGVSSAINGTRTVASAGTKTITINIDTSAEGAYDAGTGTVLNDMAGVSHTHTTGDPTSLVVLAYFRR